MIRGPKNATPTPRGWINPKTGELLKVQRLTDAQIAEWYGVDPVEPIEQPAPALYELDRRKTRATLVEEMREILSK